MPLEYESGAIDYMFLITSNIKVFKNNYIS